MDDIQAKGLNKNPERGYRGYTISCGVMMHWIVNVEHVAFLGKEKIQSAFCLFFIALNAFFGGWWDRDDIPISGRYTI